MSVLENVGYGQTMTGTNVRTSQISNADADVSSPDIFAKFDKTQGFELGIKNSVGSTKKAISVKQDGTYITGTLHGTWQSDATVTTSDRRLKTSIEPLYRTIAAQAQDRLQSSGKVVADQDISEGGVDNVLQKGRQRQDSSINWLLRELRPVSFHLKRGPEAKYLKFGFIAQELETVFPNLVRKSSDDETLSVASQDLIAVLTLAFQNLQRNFEEQRDYFMSKFKEQALRNQQERDELMQRMENLERVVYAARV